MSQGVGHTLRRLRRPRKAQAEPKAAAGDEAAAGASMAARPQLRATLIVNPYSSGLTARRERIIVQTLRQYVDLEVRRTERGGHALELAREARAAGAELLVACGGDGTANEILNGLDLHDGTAPDRPMFTLIPAGGTNVLCRSLGLPNDPVRATTQLVTAIVGRRYISVNLGKIDERLFMFAAGVGFDGALVRRIEEKRRGRRPTDLSHVTTILGLFARERLVFDERMTITIDGTGEQLRAGLLMVGNTSPLSYMGRLAMNFMPECRLEGGLDFMAPRRASAWFAIKNSMQAMGLTAGRTLISADKAQLRQSVTGLNVECDEPQPCQVDGEYIGDRSHIRFSSLPDAIRLVY